jgi:hypothetical protein
MHQTAIKNVPPNATTSIRRKSDIVRLTKLPAG